MNYFFGVAAVDTGNVGVPELVWGCMVPGVELCVSVDDSTDYDVFCLGKHIQYLVGLVLEATSCATDSDICSVGLSVGDEFEKCAFPWYPTSIHVYYVDCGAFPSNPRKPDDEGL